MGRVNDRLMKSGEKVFQKVKAIRKMIIGIGIAFHAFATIYAAEEVDSIPFHARNATWQQKTELTVTVFYEGQEEGNAFSLILDGVSLENKEPEKSTSLRNGKINKISLLLQNYYGQDSNIVGTAIAFLDFNPRPLWSQGNYL